MKVKMSAMMLVAILALTACGGPGSTVPQQQAEVQRQVAERQTYIPKNSLEFDNYNKRQEIADDPTTILWCTFFPSTVGQEPFTIPIIGKLTSGGKRPFQSEQNKCCGDIGNTWNPELPQPDGMYGSSGEYRYGFTPSGYYVDFTDMPSFCTTQPTIWQRNETQIILGVDTEWAAMQKQVQELLAAGDVDGATKLLETIEGE